MFGRSPTRRCAMYDLHGLGRRIKRRRAAAGSAAGSASPQTSTGLCFRAAWASYSTPEYGTSFAGFMLRGRCREMRSLALAAPGGLRAARREWNWAWRVSANWEDPCRRARCLEAVCSCEWPARCLTTAVLSRRGWPYADRAKGKTVDDSSLRPFNCCFGRARHELRGLIHGRAREGAAEMGSLQHAGTAAGMSSVVLRGVRRTAERHRGTSQAGARMPGSIGGGLAWSPLFAGVRAHGWSLSDARVLYKYGTLISCKVQM